MKFRDFMAIVIAFCTVVAIPAALRLEAQDRNRQTDRSENKIRHHHYKLFDLGSFGGPGAPGNGFGGNGPSSPQLNRQGMSVGSLDSATPDPNAPNMCFFDCYVDISFVWRDGVVAPLPPLHGREDLSSYPFGINMFGQIAGQAQNGATDTLTGWPELRAVLWDTGRIFDLGTLGGNESTAQSLNDFGQVVGASLTGTLDPFANSNLGACAPYSGGTFAFNALAVPGATETHAFVWQNWFMRDLGTLGGPDSTAWINNDRGEVAGHSFVSFEPNSSTGVPTVDPFFWSPEDGTMTDLGGLGGTCGFAIWLNNRGQVVGAATTPGDQTEHPFIWSKSQGMVDLFLNGGLGGTFGHPDFVNDAAEVVGYATIAGDQDGHGFLWRNGVMIDLGTVGADPDSEAGSINANGQIVGTSFSAAADADLHGFLWENEGPIVDLNTLVLPGTSMTVTAALLINDRGEIACEGSSVTIPNDHPCMLVPCDENHPGVEGCDYDMVDISARPQNPEPAPNATQHSSDRDVDSLRLIRQRRRAPSCIRAGAECRPHESCCPGLTCVAASVRAFCE